MGLGAAASVGSHHDLQKAWIQLSLQQMCFVSSERSTSNGIEIRCLSSQVHHVTRCVSSQAHHVTRCVSSQAHHGRKACVITGASCGKMFVITDTSCDKVCVITGASCDKASGVPRGCGESDRSLGGFSSWRSGSAEWLHLPESLRPSAQCQV